MSRNKRLLYNTVFGILKQVVTVICGFILPRYMILYYGSSVNGLISSISHFLGFITLLEMGIGPVVQANLYKPLAEKNEEEISKIIISAERFFRKIALIFLAYIAILFFVFPLFINSDFDFWYTASLIFIISISTIAQYFFGATYQLLLNADQKAYIQIGLQIITLILNTGIGVLLVILGAPVHLVKLLSATLFLIRPIGQTLYVHKHYHIDKKIRLNGEPIKQKWNGFAQHLAGAVCNSTDVIVLTFFSTLANISVYNVYYNVTIGVTNLIITAATGIDSAFGEMIAKQKDEELLTFFEIVEYITHFLVTIVFSVTAIMIVPFVAVYTRGVTDANYITPLFGICLVIAYATQAIRVPYARIVNAAGKFKETQNGALISAMLNVIITIALVFKFGLVGTALGTLVAMLYHTIYYVWYLQKNVLNRKMANFIKYIVLDMFCGVVSYFIVSFITFEVHNYTTWLIRAIISGVIVLGICLICFSIFVPRISKKCLKMISSRIKVH